MVKVHLELEGSVADVVRDLHCIVNGAVTGAVGLEGIDTHPCAHSLPQGDGVAVHPEETTTVGPPLVLTWTEALAADFVAGVSPEARRMMFHVWRAGDAGIHRSLLCRQAELTPVEVRGLLIGMGHTLGRFRRQRGVSLSRPVVANTPLQTYCIDPEFAGVASHRMFEEDG